MDLAANDGEWHNICATGKTALARGTSTLTENLKTTVPISAQVT